MTRRLPLVPTLLVGAAIALMIGLGLWQLQRLHWKQQLLADYARASGKPLMAWPAIVDPENPSLFRRAGAMCVEVVGWRSTSGRNLRGEPGWVHIANCRTGGAEGPGMQAVMGWSARPDNPRWTGGRISGIIAPDTQHVIRLVADTPAPGLVAAQPPALSDIPNNHLAYAVQWFLFAAVALIVYILALRGRRTGA